MSFEEELRAAMPDLNLPDRNNLLQNAAKCCVKIFKTACLQNAHIGRQAFHDSAYYCDGTGKQMLLYAVPDDVFEQAMERQKLMSQYPPVVILRMSEAKPFISLVREEFLHHDMPNAKIELHEDVLSYLGTGRYRLAYEQYDFVLSMSW